MHPFLQMTLKASKVQEEKNRKLAKKTLSEFKPQEHSKYQPVV
jgi:hypothetical protein